MNSDYDDLMESVRRMVETVRHHWSEKHPDILRKAEELERYLLRLGE